MSEPMKRVTDTGALLERDLTERQGQALKELEAILKRMSTDGAEARKGTRPPWAVADLREGRVILLNGARGTGKTSLLLTLADPERRRGGGSEIPQVRFLPFVDLDPVPDGLPMIGWLLQALMPLARWLDEPKDASPVRCNRVRDPKELTKTFVEQLRELQRIAVLSWDWSRSPRDGRGQIDWTLDAQNQLEDWARFECSWRELVDALVKSEKLKAQLGEAGLLVITLDDPDLYRARAADLVQTLRLLWHPRVVFVLAGSLRQLTEELTLDLARQMSAGFHGQEDVKAWLELARWEGRPRTMAKAILQKVLPTQNVVDLGRTGLYGLLEQESEGIPSLRTLLGEVSLPRSADGHGGGNVGDLLGALRELLPGAFRDDDMTLRTWAQLRAALMDVVELPEEERPIHALQTLLGALDRDDVEFEVHSRGKKELDLLVRLSAPSATLGYAPLSDGGGKREASVPVYLARVDRLVRADGEGVGTSPHPFVLLAADAAAVTPRQVRVDGETPLVFEAWTWFFHTRTRVLGEEVDVPWPWIPPRNLGELIWWLDRMRAVGRSHRASEGAPRHWVAIWICMHLDFVGGRGASNLSSLDEALREGDPLKYSLNRAFTSKHERLGQWLRQGFYLLAAPESGLPEDFCAQLLRATEQLGWPPGPPPAPQEALRHQRMRLALAGAGRPVPGTPRLELTARALEETRSNALHPWNIEMRSREDRGWWLGTMVPRPGGRPMTIKDVLAARTYSLPGQGSRNGGKAYLLDLFQADRPDSFSMRALSRFLQPSTAGGSARLSGLVEVMKDLRDLSPGAAAPALKALFDWLISVLPHSPAWSGWVTLTEGGTDLRLNEAPPLRLEAEIPGREMTVAKITFRLSVAPRWRAVPLPPESPGESTAEGEALAAILAAIQSYAADRSTSPLLWTTHVPPLLDFVDGDGQRQPLPWPPIVAWVNAEVLIVEIMHALWYIIHDRAGDRDTMRCRWLLLVWVEQSCRSLQRDGRRLPSIDSEGRLPQDYPVEDLSLLARSATNLSNLPHILAREELWPWVEETARLVGLALDPEARDAWKSGLASGPR